MYDEKVDVLENALLTNNARLLNLLLKDKTTGRNIIWGTSDYFELYFNGYEPYEEIRSDSITGMFGNIIKPRIAKDVDKQIRRTKNSAEVFTPAWVCNLQNNLIDERWFGRKEVFNREKDFGWITSRGRIEFNGLGKTWKQYVDARRLEISCGEAPYLVSRYDQATGYPIAIEDRIGILDRKLRVVCENASSHNEWHQWALRAIQSVYGFEYQGDNLLLARENVLYTFIDFYRFFLNKDPNMDILLKAANIIVWNIWQMDGLTNKPPLIHTDSSMYRRDLAYSSCRIRDWRTHRTVKFSSLVDH